jgi:3-mercaptopyruvate sulfurtransferase SseA
MSVSLLVAILVALVLGGCNSTDRSSSNAPAATPAVAVNGKSPATVHADGVRRVTVSELQDLLAKGQAVVVDVRTQVSFEQAHIKGAKLIPTNEVANRAGELPRDKTIVTYCS